MVHDIGTESVSDDDPAQSGGMMADLPPLLLGTYTPKIDAKGRMALPAKFRSQLGSGMVMARGQERCVYLLPQSEFRRIAVQIQHTSMGNKAARDYLRVFRRGRPGARQARTRACAADAPRLRESGQRHCGDRRGNPGRDLEQTGMGGLLGRQGTRIFRHCR